MQSKSLEMLKHHEGVRLKPYRCPARLWTIGVGHVIDPSHIRVKFEERLSLPIPNGWDRTLTMAEVDEILAADLQAFEAGVRRLCPFALTPNRLDALTSFGFNVGLGNLQRSTIRMRHNRGDYAGAAQAFMMWTKAAGKELPGLVKRRRDESMLYLTE